MCIASPRCEDAEPLAPWTTLTSPRWSLRTTKPTACMSRACSGTAPGSARPAQHSAHLRVAATGDALALLGARPPSCEQAHRPHTTAVDMSYARAPAASSASPAVAVDSLSGVIFRTDAFKRDVGGVLPPPSQLVHLLDAKREQWRHQWEYEQTLQTEPWRQLKTPKAAGALQSPWQQSAELAALTHRESPLLLTGQPVWMPHPTSGIAALGASRAWKAREDAGRWPSSPTRTSRAISSLPQHEAGAQQGDAKQMPGAASSLAAVRAPPSAPAGVSARANAQFLGAEVLRQLSPRVNVRPPSPPLVKSTATVKGPHLSAILLPETVGSAVFESTSRLDHYTGGGLVTTPMVGHGPIFDPRAVQVFPGGFQRGGSSDRGSARGSARGSQRSARRTAGLEDNTRVLTPGSLHPGYTRVLASS